LKPIAVVFGTLCGGFVGLALGASVASCVGLVSQFVDPDDPTASQSSIIGVATAPLGGLLGAVFGGLMVARRPGLFCATFLPLAFLFVALGVTVSVLQRTDRPRHYLVEVLGTPGAEYIGVVAVEGHKTWKAGTLPTEFEHEGLRIAMAFALVHPDGQKHIRLQITVNGVPVNVGPETQTGVRQTLRSYGYSQIFGDTVGGWEQMSLEDVKNLIVDGTTSPPLGKE
jgi:hypothetical protein